MRPGALQKTSEYVFMEDGSHPKKLAGFRNTSNRWCLVAGADSEMGYEYTVEFEPNEFLAMSRLESSVGDIITATAMTSFNDQKQFADNAWNSLQATRCFIKEMEL